MRKAFWCAMLAACTATRLASAQTAQQILVRLADSEIFPAETLEKAQLLADKILSKAGISAHWIHCRSKADRRGVTSPCRDGSGPGNLRFGFIEEGGVSLDVWTLGYALPTNYSGAVRYLEVKTAAKDLRTEEYVVLGVVLAHEIGHLSGLERHSPNGIMARKIGRAQVLFADQGTLLFDEEQARQMQTYLRVSRRMGGEP